MEKERGSKVIAIIALCIGIVGLSLGFAAFSSNLVIEPSANVTPDSSSFKVVFSKVATSEQAGTLSPILGNGASATINNTSNDTPTISNLKANFVSPGETTKYEFYAYNAGEYQSYLTNITFNNVTGTELTKTCTPESGTTKALVDAACEGITMYINIDGLLADATMNTSGHSIDQAKAHKVVITINYDSNAARADGPFTVSFGDIQVKYMSVEGTGTSTGGLTISEGIEETPASCFETNVEGSKIAIINYTCSETDVVIPSTIDGKEVYVIGDSAFNDKGLTSVLIPNTVETIGESAFNFNNLTSIIIPNSVKTIGEYAFANNPNLTSISLGNGVQSIANYAFAENQNLTSITIPSSVTSVDECTFCETYFTSVIIQKPEGSLDLEYDEMFYWGRTGVIKWQP